MKTVVINGLKWDTENLVSNEKTHFRHEEALKLAEDCGKRLPTKNEFEELLRLPHAWDDSKRGIWFAEHWEDLMSDRSLFLPAAGGRYLGRTTLYGVGMDGNYWSATPNDTTSACYMYLYSSNIYMYNNYRNYGFSVRCVSNIKQNNKKK